LRETVFLFSKQGKNVQNYLCKSQYYFRQHGFCCARLSTIFDVPEVKIKCSISVFRLVLSGDVQGGSKKSNLLYVGG